MNNLQSEQSNLYDRFVQAAIVSYKNKRYGIGTCIRKESINDVVDLVQLVDWALQSIKQKWTIPAPLPGAAPLLFQSPESIIQTALVIGETITTKFDWVGSIPVPSGGYTYDLFNVTSDTYVIDAFAGLTLNESVTMELIPNNLYRFRVRSVYTQGVSGFASIVFTTPSAVITTPSCNIVITNINTVVTVNRIGSFINYTGNAFTSVEYSIDNAPWFTVPSFQIDSSSVGATEIVIENVPAGTYVIKYRLMCLNGIYSNIVTKNVTVNATVVQKKSYWGVSPSNTPLTLAAIEASTGFGLFAAGGTIIADYRTNTVLTNYLWVAVPYDQPVITSWYATVDNNGAVGTTNDLFIAPVIIDTNKYRLYFTAYKTRNTTDLFEFRNT